LPDTLCDDAASLSVAMRFGIKESPAGLAGGALVDTAKTGLRDAEAFT